MPSFRSHPVDFPISDLVTDPDRFQSRAAYPRDVMDTDLSDVKVFNHLGAGVLSVWCDPSDQAIYVIDGHRRLELARRTKTGVVLVRFLSADSDSEAFATGVLINIIQWVFERGDKLLWACASRRAAVERALHIRWLDPECECAKRLFEFYPDLARRYRTNRPRGRRWFPALTEPAWQHANVASIRYGAGCRALIRQ